jgi:hypothetical protein
MTWKDRATYNYTHLQRISLAPLTKLSPQASVSAKPQSHLPFLSYYIIVLCSFDLAYHAGTGSYSRVQAYVSP